MRGWRRTRSERRACAGRSRCHPLRNPAAGLPCQSPSCWHAAAAAPQAESRRVPQAPARCHATRPPHPHPRSPALPPSLSLPRSPSLRCVPPPPALPGSDALRQQLEDSGDRTRLFHPPPLTTPPPPPSSPAIRGFTPPATSCSKRAPAGARASAPQVPMMPSARVPAQVQPSTRRGVGGLVCCTAGGRPVGRGRAKRGWRGRTRAPDERSPRALPLPRFAAGLSIA